MSSTVFFEGDRSRFFRPLNSTRRELVVACLRALYERLHGPTADYSHNMTLDALRELMFPVVRDHLDREVPEAEHDEFNEPEANDPQQLTTLLMRALLADGWLERFGIDAAVHEFNCQWSAGLARPPLGRDWERYGASLVRVFDAWFTSEE